MDQKPNGTGWVLARVIPEQTTNSRMVNDSRRQVMLIWHHWNVSTHWSPSHHGYHSVNDLKYHATIFTIFTPKRAVPSGAKFNSSSVTGCTKPDNSLAGFEGLWALWALEAIYRQHDIGLGCIVPCVTGQPDRFYWEDYGRNTPFNRLRDRNGGNGDFQNSPLLERTH